MLLSGGLRCQVGGGHADVDGAGPSGEGVELGELVAGGEIAERDPLTHDVING